MKRMIFALIALTPVVALALVAVRANRPTAADHAAYEVWAIDQADTTADGGGTLHIYDGAALAGRTAATARSEVIDLGGTVRDLCLAQTGSAPRRPHMFFFNQSHSHAALAFVASGHVLFMEGQTRRPVACIDAGEQAHAAVPSPDQTYVLVANQNGKLLQRIHTDYAAGRFTLEDAATLNLATCRTPSGAACQDMTLRPDNAPICAAIEDGGRLAFVTLRGGGLFVLDVTATPMAIVAEYDHSVVKPNGCGAVQARGKMYINSGGGTAMTPFAADLYAFPLDAFSAGVHTPNTPPPAVVFSRTGRADSHGAAVTRGGRYLWVADRAANRIMVVDLAADTMVDEINLAGALSDDPAPDLLDISPSGDLVFAALRGPLPLTGNAPMANNAVGSTPGVAVLRVTGNGRTGELAGVARISRMVDGSESADPHAIGVRRK